MRNISQNGQGSRSQTPQTGRGPDPGFALVVLVGMGFRAAARLR